MCDPSSLNEFGHFIYKGFGSSLGEHLRPLKWHFILVLLLFFFIACGAKVWNLSIRIKKVMSLVDPWQAPPSLRHPFLKFAWWHHRYPSYCPWLHMTLLSPVFCSKLIPLPAPWRFVWYLTLYFEPAERDLPASGSSRPIWRRGQILTFG